MRRQKRRQRYMESIGMTGFFGLFSPYTRYAENGTSERSAKSRESPSRSDFSSDTVQEPLGGFYLTRAVQASVYAAQKVRRKLIMIFAKKSLGKKRGPFY
jgi:hypothetical protein